MPTAVDDAVKTVFVKILEDPEMRSWPVAKIYTKAVRLIRARDPNAPVPSESWAYVFVRSARRRLSERTWLDEPWSVGSFELPGMTFSDEAVRCLLDIARRAWILGVPFTNRQAKWVGRLRSTFVPAWNEAINLPMDNNEQLDLSGNVSILYALGTLYANEERAASVLGKTLNTSNLDFSQSLGYLPGQPLASKTGQEPNPLSMFVALANDLSLVEGLQSQALEVVEAGMDDQLTQWFMTSPRIEEVFHSVDNPNSLKFLLHFATPLATDLTILALLFVHEQSEGWKSATGERRHEWAKELLRNAHSGDWDAFMVVFGELANLHVQEE